MGRSGRIVGDVRVAVVAESFLPRINGVTGSVLRTARHLIARGHQVDIIAPEPAPSATSDGARVHSVRSLSVSVMGVDVGWASTARLQNLLTDLQPDVVHLASPLLLGHQAMKAAVALHLPTVAVFQTDVSGFARHYSLRPLGSISDAVIQRIHGHADVNLVPSTHSQAYLEGLQVQRIRQWGRGVDTDQFSPEHRSEELRRLWCGRHHDRVVVGYIGRLAPEKNVAALAPLAQDSRLAVVVVGDGPQRADLEELMPRARFLGLLTGDRLGKAAASFDVLVAPGERETFCQVVQEGMASGVPVVAPAVGGPRDLVHHGRTGFLYSPGRVDEMTAAVRLLQRSPPLRRSMGHRGRAIVRDRTWERIGDELLGHYAEAIARRRRMRAAAA